MVRAEVDVVQRGRYLEEHLFFLPITIWLLVIKRNACSCAGAAKRSPLWPGLQEEAMKHATMSRLLLPAPCVQQESHSSLQVGLSNMYRVGKSQPKRTTALPPALFWNAKNVTRHHWISVMKRVKADDGHDWIFSYIKVSYAKSNATSGGGGFLATEFLALKKSGLHMLLWTGLRCPLQIDSKSIILHSAAMPAIYWGETSAEDGDEK